VPDRRALPLRNSGSQPVPERHAGDRSDAWRISLALLVCFWVTFAALHTILEGFNWWFTMAGFVLVVLGASAISRALSARIWVPPLTGALVLVGALTAFFSEQSAFLIVVPTFETWGVFGDLVQEGARSIASQTVPAEATVGITFLVSVGAGIFAIATDLLAVAWRRPALAAIPLAVFLFLPTVIGIALGDLFIFVLAAIAWLGLLRAGQPYSQARRATGVGAAALTVALIVPLGLPQVGTATPASDGFDGYLSGVNPVLSLGSNLRRDIPRTVLTYSSDSGAPTYLRLVSLQNFTAETWEPDATVIDQDNLPSSVGPPPGLASDISVESATTWVKVENLGSPWLPVPYPATQVSGLTGEWFWNANDLTFASLDRPARGQQFQVQSLDVQPTPRQLAAAGRVIPGDFEKYLALPEGMPPVIASEALEITTQSTSDYGKAVALQDYFRSTFAYSEIAPVEQGYDGNGMDVLAKFLEVRSGYCIHFASAMAVMARTLGIPSRVAVGLLPGKRQDALEENRIQYRVTTKNVHSWPELYFEGIGWTRFEPTPGRGFVPTYADEATPGVPTTLTPNATPTPTSTPTIAPSANASTRDLDDTVAGGGSQTASLGWLWLMLSVLGVITVLLLPALVRSLQRSIRLRRISRGSPIATTGWREILQLAADLGVEVSGSATPREAARTLEAATSSVVAIPARFVNDGQSALDVVATRVERESFSDRPPSAADSGLEQHVRAVLWSLRSAAGWKARMAATFAPRSTWRRLVGVSRGD